MTIPSPRSGEPFFHGHEDVHGEVYDVAAPVISEIRQDLTETANKMAALLARLHEVDPNRQSEAHKRLGVTRNMLNNALAWLDRSDQALNQPPAQESP